MTEELGVQTVSDSVMSIEQSRAIQEVQASLVIAKKFPRDQDAAYLRIMKACERYSLADQAEYAYPRGDKTVTGPTIKLAETIAQNWGNMNSGVRELSQLGGESEVEAFAWDLETNYKDTKTFTVKHKRYTKARGNVSLTDPRDIYEYIANNGARRKRACILTIIPGDIVEKAIEQCRATVRKGIKEKPLRDQIRSTLKAFDSLGIMKEMIEKRLGHGTDAIIEDELIELNNIGRSIKDNMTTREEWFDVKGEQQQKAQNLTDKIKADTPAQDLKAKLEVGDQGIEGYKDLKGEDTKTASKILHDRYIGNDPERKAALEEERIEAKKGNNQNNTKKGLSKDDPLFWLSTCRPGSSISLNERVIAECDKYDNDINMLEDKDLRARIVEKYHKAKTLMSKQEPKKMSKSLPGEGLPEKDEYLNGIMAKDKTPERLEFEKKMGEYYTIDAERFDEIMGAKDMNDIKTKTDEDAILEVMSEAFGG